MKLRSLWDRVRQGLWFLPSVIVLVSAGLAAAMIEIDALLYRRDLEPTSIIFGGSAEGARGVLSAIAGGLITVTGVVFSITIVALQLASTQFTPRVLQNFMGDRGNQIVLGVFLGTFTYTLLILRTIRSAVEGYLPFVPGASVTVAVVLTLISMGLLIYYLQNVTGWIEASSIIDRVTRDTLIQIRKRFPVAFMEDHEYADPSAPRKPARMGATTIADAAFEPDDAPAWLLALKSGYLERIHHDDLFSLAVERDLVIRLEHGVGDFVVEATPLLSIWPREALDSPLLEELRGTLDIGHRRTITQDAELGIIQLSDIAVKAMSPSINDPTTAMMAIDRLGQIIAELGGRFPRDRIRTDDTGRVRIVSPAFDFAAAADVAFSQIRRYAAADAAVMSHLALTLSIIGSRVGPQDRQALLGLLGEIEDGARARMDHEADRRRVADAVARAKRRLARLGGSAATVLALLCGAATPALAQDTIPALGRDTIAALGRDTAALAQAATQSADSVAADQVSLTDTMLGSARHAVLALASDTWATLAAPFRLDGPEAWKVGGAVAATALLLVFDEDIQRAIERNRDDPFLHAVEETGDFVQPVALMGNTNIYWASGMVIGHVTGRDEVRHIFEELLFSHWIASLTRKSLGRSLGRLRPFESPDDPFARVFWDGTSFPSGHASTAMQVAAVLAHHIDWWPADVALYGLAGSVVYHRIATGDHWTSDSVLGALWGYGVAQVVIARREADRTDFVPFFDPGAGAVGLRVSTPF